MKKTLVESIILDLMGESGPVIEDDGNLDLKTMVKYVTMPGVIVAQLRGQGTECVQELPIGGIDQFKFVDMTDGNMFWNRDDSGKNDKEYEDFMRQYSDQKSQTLRKWYSDNKETYDSVKKKFGERIVGFDIVPNKTKVQNPEPDEQEKPEKSDEKPVTGQTVGEDEKPVENPEG